MNKQDKQKHYGKLPLYGAVGCLLLSASTVVYLAQQNNLSMGRARAEVPMNCLGPGCPRIQAVASPGPISPRPQVPVATGSDPCAFFNPVSTQSYSAQGHRHRHRHHRHRKSFLDRFWEFILWLLEKFGITIPGFDPNPTPVPNPIIGPSQTPTPVPSGSNPKPVDPCVTPVVPGVASVVPQPVLTSGGQGQTISSEISFYTSAEGGANVAYSKIDGFPTLHNTPEGDGSYANPISFAAYGPDWAECHANIGICGAQIGSSVKTKILVGTRVYVSRFGKYFMFEDKCPECGDGHIDLYIGDGSAAGCASDMGIVSDKIIINPDPNLTVDSRKMFDPATGACPFK